MRPRFAVCALLLFVLASASGVADEDGFTLNNPPFYKPIQAITKARAFYEPYLRAEKSPDFGHMSALLTPDFTMTHAGTSETHLQSLADMKAIIKTIGEYRTQGHYRMTLDEFSVRQGHADAQVQEQVDHLPTDIALIANDTLPANAVSASAACFWTQHWVKTPQGWRLKNVEQRLPWLPSVTDAEGFVIKDLRSGSFREALEDAHSLYDPYVQAEKASDFSALAVLLTPDFTCTFEGKQDNLAGSLQAMKRIRATIRGFRTEKNARYELIFNKLFVRDDQATAVIEEKLSSLSDFPPVLHTSLRGIKETLTIPSISFAWTQHWIKTPQGWRLKSLVRTMH